ncbi:helix-turn-helix domain-containing protein [Bradyrhizobium diazoefficiens]|nr:helix-turn-helix domain-containing protein [Bradyrhizobium diazoefficiens]MBR0777244.1 helix-turn-helix domain-containing protein [Bradyrhizobium diazoefficiens]
MQRLLGQAGISSKWFNMEHIDYCKGAIVFRQAQPCEYVYQVIAGAVRAQKLLPDGRRQIAGFHLVGDIFGLETVATHRFEAVAIVQTTLRLMSRRALDDRVVSEPTAFRALLGVITKSLIHAENHMLLLGCQDSDERVATFLMEMHSRSTSGRVTHLPMSRRDIADYLGLTLETVSRAMAKFRRDGLLKFVDAQRRAVILDRQALAAMADEARLAS